MSSHHAVAYPGRDRLLDVAESRWKAVSDRRPDLQPALDLQRRLITIVVDVTESLGGTRLPRLSLPPKYIRTKLNRGVPALAGEPIPLPMGLLGPLLLALCDALASG